MDRRSFLKVAGLAPIAAWLGIQVAPGKKVVWGGALDAPNVTDRSLVAAIDIYDSDFGTLEALPDAFVNGSSQRRPQD